MSWRDDEAERYERMCGLNPEAVGLGPIDRTAMPWWKDNPVTDHGESHGCGHYYVVAHAHFDKETIVSGGWVYDPL